MTTITSGFEQGPDGTAVTTANSGGGGDTAFDLVFAGTGASVTYDSTYSAHGTLAAACATTTSSGQAKAEWQPTALGSPSISKLWFRCYFYFASLPASNCGIAEVLTSGGTECARLIVTSGGVLEFLDSAHATQLTSANTVPAGAWFRVEGYCVGDASAGQLEFRLFLTPDSVTPDETQTSGSALNTTGTIGEASFGLAGFAPAGTSVWIDDVGASDTGYIGPVSTGETAAVAVTVARPSTSAAGSVGAAVTAAAAVVVPRPTVAVAGNLGELGTAAVSVPRPSVAASGVVGAAVTAAVAVSVPRPSTLARGGLAEPPSLLATPLGTAVELKLGGTWTDITGWAVEDTSQVVITRGRPDGAQRAEPSKAAMTWDNTDGRFSPRNPLSPYYGLLGRNTAVRVSVPATSTYLRLEDDAVSYVSAADSAGLSVTGSLDIRIEYEPTSYGAVTLAAKWDDAGNERGWLLRRNSTSRPGAAQLVWSPDGVSAHGVFSTAPLPLGHVALRATLDAATGIVTFYTAPAITGPWAQLGDAVDSGSGATSVYDNTQPVQVGYSTGTTGYASLQGRIFAFRMLDGIGGTVVASPDFTTAIPGAVSLTDSQGGTWTLQGTAEFSDRDYRFHGQLGGLPQTWDLSGHDVRTPVNAAGVLRRLRKASAPLDSALKRASVQQSGTYAPAAYWPCEDGRNATQIASGLGGPAMRLTGGPPTFAADSGFACSQPLPQFNGSRWHGDVPAYATAGDAITRFLLHVPTGGSVDGAPLMRVHTTGTVAFFVLAYYTGGGLGIQGYAPDGSQLFDTGGYGFGADGTRLRVSMELRQSGTDVTYDLAILTVGTTSTGIIPTGTLTGASVGHVNHVQANHTGQHTDTAAGHISVQTAWVDPGSDIIAAVNAWVGETAGDRVGRLCAEQGVSSRITGYPALTVPMGAQLPKSFSDLLGEVENADRGILHEARDSLSVAYRTLASMCGQDPAITLDYATQLSPPLNPTEDLLATTNDVTVSRADGGSSARAVLDDGSPMSTTGIGPYPTSPAISLASDAQLDDEAGWILHVGSADEPRYPVLTTDLGFPEVAGITDDLRAVGIGDQLVVTDAPAWLPPGDIRQLAAGLTETLATHEWVDEWHTVPASPYDVASAGAGSRAGAGGAAVHAATPAGSASFRVDIAAGYPLWTTDPADFPLDVMISGQRVRVTAISGTTTPQMFTVGTWAVNGVVKDLAAGDAVIVADNPAVALTSLN